MLLPDDGRNAENRSHSLQEFNDFAAIAAMVSFVRPGIVDPKVHHRVRLHRPLAGEDVSPSRPGSGFRNGSAGSRLPFQRHRRHYGQVSVLRSTSTRELEAGAGRHSFGLVPAVFAFAMNSDGSLGARTTVPVASSLTFPDGLAVDETGSLYVADYSAGTVLRAADGAAIARLTNPASLAFRGSTLLITDYRLGAPTRPGGLYAVNLGVCGSAQ
jgi:hypothetical protein